MEPGLPAKETHLEPVCASRYGGLEVSARIPAQQADLLTPELSKRSVEDAELQDEPEQWGCQWLSKAVFCWSSKHFDF